MIEARQHHHQILAALGQHASSYLEIGVQEGDSVVAVAARNKNVDLTLCDTWGSEHGGTGRGDHQHVDVRLTNVGHHGSRLYLDGRSSEMLPSLAGQTFDLVNVDGDHSYEGALSDLRLVWLFVGRYLVIHDAFFESVRNATFDWLNEVGRANSGIRSIELSISDHGTFLIQRNHPQ